MRKFTDYEIQKLKKYWAELKHMQHIFDIGVQNLENRMQKDLQIDDLEFFNSDGYCGIGNLLRTVYLIHSYELEK